MAADKSTRNARSTARVPLVVPASRPRNPLAVDPLLKKSAAHTDKRLRSKIEDGADEVANALRMPHPPKDGD